MSGGAAAIPDFAALHPGYERPGSRCKQAPQDRWTMHFHSNLRVDPGLVPKSVAGKVRARFSHC